MYGMYGSIDSVGAKGVNPFITKPGAANSDNNPFTAQANNDKNNFDPAKLFEGGTVGLGPETEAKQRLTIGIA